jgi:hypothetical protein
LSIFQEGKSDGKDTLKLETNAEAGKVSSMPDIVYYTVSTIEGWCY